MWNDALRFEFTRIDITTTFENKYNGAYLQALNVVFPFAEGWRVFPQFPVPGTLCVIDYAITHLTIGEFRVNGNMERYPVMFFELKAPQVRHSLAGRLSAHQQMHSRFPSLIWATPMLHSMSLIGTNFHHYKCDAARAATPRIVPVRGWSLDHLTEHGFQRFLQIINLAKAAVTGNRHTSHSLFLALL